MTQEEAFKALAARLYHARREHPVFAESTPEALSTIHDELEELFDAANYESPARVIDEAIDVAATAMRLVMGEVQA